MIREFEKKICKPINFICLNISSDRTIETGCFDNQNNEIGEATVKKADKAEIAVIAGFFADEKINLKNGFFNINFLFSKTAAAIECRLTEDSEKPDVKTLIKF